MLSTLYLVYWYINKYLANPKTEVLTVQRSQLLTLILLNKLLVGYGFKDAADSFKVRST